MCTPASHPTRNNSPVLPEPHSKLEAPNTVLNNHLTSLTVPCADCLEHSPCRPHHHVVWCTLHHAHDVHNSQSKVCNSSHVCPKPHSHVPAQAHCSTKPSTSLSHSCTQTSSTSLAHASPHSRSKWQPNTLVVRTTHEQPTAPQSLHFQPLRMNPFTLKRNSVCPATDLRKPTYTQHWQANHTLVKSNHRGVCCPATQPHYTFSRCAVTPNLSESSSVLP
jgi:hypothetical protein